jgi:cytochrome c-type biogenesis protein CcmH
MIRLVFVAALALVWGAPAASAAGCGKMVGQLESELMCPTCQGETLAESPAPEAKRIVAFAHRRCAAGASKGQIKDELVAQFGQSILAAPPKKGFGLLAWILPLVGVIAGAVILGVLARRWARSREPEPAAVGRPAQLNGRPLSPELEQRVDEELARFD